MEGDKHYKCQSCGGVSDFPKNCETESCSAKGTPLTKCDCSDKANHDQDDDNSDDDKEEYTDDDEYDDDDDEDEDDNDDETDNPKYEEE